MPYIKAKIGVNVCADGKPCKVESRCPKCLAERYLDADDWTVIQIYAEVKTQFVNQNPFGEAFNTIRFEAILASLDLRGFHGPQRKHLAAAVLSFYNIAHGIERVNWVRETGKNLNMVLPEDVL